MVVWTLVRCMVWTNNNSSALKGSHRQSHKLHTTETTIYKSRTKFQGTRQTLNTLKACHNPTLNFKTQTPILKSRSTKEFRQQSQSNSLSEKLSTTFNSLWKWPIFSRVRSSQRQSNFKWTKIKALSGLRSKRKELTGLTPTKSTSSNFKAWCKVWPLWGITMELSLLMVRTPKFKLWRPRRLKHSFSSSRFRWFSRDNRKIGFKVSFICFYL